MCKTKPDIEYPCSWHFKVIGGQGAELEKVIQRVVGERDSLLTYSRASSGGKFQSMNLEIVVQSEDDRNSIYRDLVSQAAVRMVL
ncbi:MAG: DUF493 domain-containing protein [Proteobacteria bacterium]|nr:DUF493 domain-containing protein [Pseudomonadota bacterium]MBU1738720.1 DUF493 domain-containing protein [Pseudomonadota bacterium]